MKDNFLNVTDEELVNLYLELKSTYKISDKLNISRYVIQKRLKFLNVLRTQSAAAKERLNNNFKYKRTEEHRQKLSELAKTRTKEKNPFYGKTHSKETKEKASNRMKEKMGELNPNYKNGEYQRRPRDFKIAEFTRLRNFCFNRDEYTCEYCGKIGGHLHGHHKIPYWFNKEAFLDIDNIVTVCTICHFEKAHLKNWAYFDIELIDERLIKRYSLDRERLNDLAVKFNRCDSPPSTNK